MLFLPFRLLPCTLRFSKSRPTMNFCQTANFATKFLGRHRKGLIKLAVCNDNTWLSGTNINLANCGVEGGECGGDIASISWGDSPSLCCLPFHLTCYNSSRRRDATAAAKKWYCLLNLWIWSKRLSTNNLEVSDEWSQTNENKENTLPNAMKK